MEHQLICKQCGQSREIGRKLCRPCNLSRMKLSAKKSVEKRGGRYTWTKSCEACGSEYSAVRKIQKFCSECWTKRKELAAESISSNRYEYVEAANREKGENNWGHRRLAEKTLNRKLTAHEVVHHIDDNPKNNDLGNLMVLSRSLHGKLHKYLDDQRVILEKSGNENLRNCWNNLIVPMTTTWLEMTSVKVIKLWEIGQSAAELLKSKDNEEGSETQL